VGDFPKGFKRLSPVSHSSSERGFYCYNLKSVGLGCLLGLFIGKPVGITLASYLAVRTDVATLPANVRWTHIIGAEMLGGIGFTMSLFISGLSFVDAQLLNYSKLGVLLGSIISACTGLIFLSFSAYRDSRSYEEA